jgi:hypothetical protein
MTARWLSRRLVLVGLLLGSVACASAPSGAETPIDWAVAAEHWSLHIVTRDADGDERVTRIWIASVDGEGALRTGDSRWWANLMRDPRCHVRLDGVDYPVTAEFVTDPAGRQTIDRVFLEKYGAWERVMFPQERGETHENYARLASP